MLFSLLFLSSNNNFLSHKNNLDGLSNSLNTIMICKYSLKFSYKYDIVVEDNKNV